MDKGKEKSQNVEDVILPGAEQNNQSSTDSSGVTLPDVGTPEVNMHEAKLDLAKNILLCLFLTTIVFGLITVQPENILKKEYRDLFDSLMKSIIPMSSLIIGYYFGSNKG